MPDALGAGGRPRDRETTHQDRSAARLDRRVAVKAIRRERRAEAERIYPSVIEARRRTLGEADTATRRTRKALAALLRQTGRPEEAQAIEAVE